MKTPEQSIHVESAWLVTLISLGLASLVFLVFGQTLGFGFIGFDDDFYVTENWHVLKGISWTNVFWALGAGTGRYMSDTDYWMPLSLISHMLDVQLFALNAGMHHAVNVLLQALNVVLLFLVIRSMTGLTWRSAFAAAFWGVHPLRTESVAWIAERKDLLGGLFFILTLGAYLGFIRRPSVRAYILMLLLYLLGIMSKPTVVTLPIVLLLLDVWPLGRLKRLRDLLPLVWEKLPLFALSIFSCLITVFTQKQTLDPNGQLPLILRAVNAVVCYCIYLGKMIYPSGLAVFYPYPPDGRAIWQVCAAIALLFALSTCVLLLRRGCPYLFVGWFWYLVMLAPASGILKAGGQAYADRFTYLPQIGLSIASIWLICGWATNGTRKASLVSVGTIALLCLMVATYNQTRIWCDSTTLFRHSLDCTKDNSLIHNNLGSVLWHEGKFSEAINHVEKALTINPANAEAQNNMGTILWSKGDRTDAIARYQKALELQPSYGAAHNNLGNALLQTGVIDQAISHLRMAVEIIPGSEEAHFNLGNALMRKGEIKESIIEFQTALLINPYSAETHNTLGSLLAATGSLEKGITEFRKAVELDPNNPSYLNNNAWALLISPDPIQRNAPAALEFARKAIRLDGGSNPSHLHTLAVAYAETGEFDLAEQTAKQAISLSELQGNSSLAGSIRREMQLYRKTSLIGSPERR